MCGDPFRLNGSEHMWFNMDEKGFMVGKLGRCKVICGWRERGITSKLVHKTGIESSLRLLRRSVEMEQYCCHW